MKKQAIAFLAAIGMLSAVLAAPGASQAQSGIGGRVNACVQTYIRTGFPLSNLAQRRERLAQFRLCIRQAIGRHVSSISSSSSLSSTSSSVSSSSSLSSSSSSTQTGVTILNFRYQPQGITIQKGTTVRWTNASNALHTVTRTGSTVGPNSPLIYPGQTYSFTFNNTGSYLYYCQLHPNMSGSVMVVQ